MKMRKDFCNQLEKHMENGDQYEGIAHHFRISRRKKNCIFF